MIARVDTDLAGLQATWTLVAIGAYVATLFVVRRVPDLARYKWTFALIGIVLLLLPFVPGVGFAAPDGARLWVSVGPINFQPGEFAKIALALFFAAYLTERRELLAAGTWKVGPVPPPRAAPPRPAAHRLGAPRSSSSSARRTWARRCCSSPCSSCCCGWRPSA